jgi:hypothetical protein
MSEKKEETKLKGFRLSLVLIQALESRATEERKPEAEIVAKALEAYLAVPTREVIVNRGQSTPPIVNNHLLTVNNIGPASLLMLTTEHKVNNHLLTVNNIGVVTPELLTSEQQEPLTQPGDNHVGTGAQPGGKLEPNSSPSQEEALAYAQNLLEEKRSKTPASPRPASQVIEASVKRGVLQRLLCSEDGCKQGAARSMNGKSYCAHHASLQDYAALPTPSAPPVSTVELPPCDVCQHRRFLVAECGGRLAAERCPHCLIDCQACEKGLIFWKDRQGYEKWLPCGCRKTPIQRQLAAIQYADFPGAFASLLFGKLPPSELSDSQKQAHILSWEWAKKFTNKEKSGFFFYGSPGTGKTLALCRALALLLQRESCLRVRYLHFPAWLDLKKQSFGSEETMECASELVGPEVLLVDEILLQGKSGVVRSFTEWERSQFDLMVHNRWLAGKPTLYATNYKPEQVEVELSESTWSRIRSTAAFFEVSGKNLRLPQNVLPFTRGSK